PAVQQLCGRLGPLPTSCSPNSPLHARTCSTSPTANLVKVFGAVSDTNPPSTWTRLAFRTGMTLSSKPESVMPVLKANRVQVEGGFVSETAPNTFTRLAVGEVEQVRAWSGEFGEHDVGRGPRRPHNCCTAG